MIVVPVELADRSYDVIVGDGATAELAALLPSRAKRAAIVTQAGIGIEVDSGRDQSVFEIGDGETAKTLATIESLCRSFAHGG